MILVCEFMDDAWVAWLRARTRVVYRPDLPDQPQDEFLGLVRDARALIVRNRTQVRGPVLDADIACVGRLGVGLDNIDMDGCRERNITVYPAVGANALSVAEYVVTTAAVLLRGAYFLRAGMEAGTWPRGTAGQGCESAGKTIGLVGFGSIARETARLARAFGMRVMAHDPHVPADDPVWDTAGVRATSLDGLLRDADIVSLHVPLTPQTRHLIGARALAALKPGAVVINTARGGVVDEAALVQSLQDGHLGGAALDTFETEPLGTTHPFAGVANLILTPHIAGVTAQANTRVSEMTARAVARHLGVSDDGQ